MQRLQLIAETIARNQNIYDYIILGAGISGIQAADILMNRPNNKILILEALPEIGGRIGSISIGGLQQAKKLPWVWKNIDQINKTIVEKGATWIEQRHTIILQLCKQFEISVRQQYGDGESIYLQGNKSHTSSNLMVNPLYSEKIKQMVKLIDDISEEYNKVIFSNVDIPSIQAKQLLKKYDAISLDKFLKDHIPEDLIRVRELFECFFQHTQCINGEENSMHDVLTKNARSNDLGILKEFLGDFGHQASYLINGGSFLLVQKFIQSIQKKIKGSINKILKLNHQVITVDNRRNDFITIICENNKIIKKYKCKQVICALPLAVSRSITFTNISLAKKLIIDNQVRTNSNKSFMIVKKPFWRKTSEGKIFANGDCLFSSQHMVNMCHDISPLDESCGIIVFFHNGKRLDAWQKAYPNKDSAKKKQYFIQLMTKMFNVSQNDKKAVFEDCFYYQCSYMTNQHIRSGFQSNSRPGTFNQVIQMGDTLNAFFRDENGITFVGSEYSLEFASYMEGAVRITRKKIYGLIGEKDPYEHLLFEKKLVN